MVDVMEHFLVVQRFMVAKRKLIFLGVIKTTMAYLKKDWFNTAKNRINTRECNKGDCMEPGVQRWGFKGLPGEIRPGSRNKMCGKKVVLRK